MPVRTYYKRPTKPQIARRWDWAVEKHAPGEVRTMVHRLRYSGQFPKHEYEFKIVFSGNREELLVRFERMVKRLRPGGRRGGFITSIDFYAGRRGLPASSSMNITYEADDMPMVRK